MHQQKYINSEYEKRDASIPSKKYFQQAVKGKFDQLLRDSYDLQSGDLGLTLYGNTFPGCFQSQGHQINKRGTFFLRRLVPLVIMF